ncbi:hypothetical protein SDJN03_11255, partial [Cucurbita argyrosperma subsp. sororia]
MGTHQSNHHPSLVVQSSIALLQERFRQLQKVKEMREERELVRLLSLSNPKKHGLFNTCVLFEPSVATMMMLPTTTTTTMTATKMLTLPQTSLSLWPTSPSPGKKLTVGVDVDVPALMNLWPVDSVTTSTSSSCDSAISLISKLEHDHESDSDIDVDTSLHL